jgi:integrase
VFDERKRAIRGLWLRNGRYYAQVTLEDDYTGTRAVRRVPLESASMPAQARQLLEEILVNRKSGKLAVLKLTPRFEEFANQYLDFYKQAKDAKRASTLETEGYAIDRWKEHLGQLRLGKIRRSHVDGYIARCQSSGVSSRTVNLEVTVFRNVMNRAIDAKWITSLPTENLRPLKSTRIKRGLATAAQIEKLCSVGFEALFCSGRLAGANPEGQPLQNAQQFADYIRLMCYCGARLSETLRLRWRDVDWQNRQITIGADGQAKNHLWRSVDFNPQLEAHLKAMFGRKAPDSDWLFPSPRRGEKDRPARTFRETLMLARAAAKMPEFGFHDCRHYFISVAVMAGIDYMTIARWVRHQDEGILIGKVYGHLSNEHAKRAAAKLNFSSDAKH